MNAAPLYRLERVRRIVDGCEVILDVDALDLPEGGLTAVVGPNGAGKSTLLQLLAFLGLPQEGAVRFRGAPVAAGDLVRLRREVTLVEQAPFLFRGSVRANVAYGLRIRGVPRAKWPARVSEALSLVDLGGFEDRSVKGLSGGETQRVAIARALVFRPQVVLLDEPTAGVDVARREMVERLLGGLHAAMGATVVFSTHSLSQAHSLTGRVIHLAGGQVVPHGVDNLFTGRADGDGDVSLPDGSTLRACPTRAGPVRFAIPAAAIEIAPHSGMDGNANSFDSVITRMELRGERARLLLSGRLNLRVELPPEDLLGKGLRLGDRVTATVPPEAIRFLTDENGRAPGEHGTTV